MMSFGGGSKEERCDSDAHDPLLTPTRSSESPSWIGSMEERDSLGSLKFRDSGMSSTTPSRWSVASEEVSFIKSAMDVQQTQAEKDARSTSVAGFYTSNSTMHPTAAARSHSTAATVTSKVLARALEQPQSARAAQALTSSSTGLPGGLAPRGSIRRPARRDSGKGGFSAAARGQQVAPGSPGRVAPRNSSGTNRLDNLHLLVEKWGLRKKGYGHDEGDVSLQIDDSRHSDSDSETQHPQRLVSFARLGKKADKERSTYIASLATMHSPTHDSAVAENVNVESSDDIDSKSSMKKATSTGSLQLLAHGDTHVTSGVSPARSSGSDLSQMTRSSPRTGLSSRISLLSPSSGGSNSTLMEVEFEVSLRIVDNPEDPFASASGGWGKKRSSNAKEPNKWTVWRTGKELLSLHAVLVGLFGDLAPRRPKLHTCFIDTHQSTSSPVTVKESTSVSREAILSDMRLIAGYLRALINQPIFHCSAFISFLEIPTTILPVVTSNEFSVDAIGCDIESGRDSIVGFDSFPSPSEASHAPSGQTVSALMSLTSTSNLVEPRKQERSASESSEGKDQFRKVFMNLRKNLKPREIAVRCRVFDGVISGADIAKWMMSSVHKYAQDDNEARLIAQGLVGAELLCPVCAGYRDLEETSDGGEDSSEAVGVLNLLRSSSGTVVPPIPDYLEERNPDVIFTFSSAPGYIYRYPGKSATVGGVGAFTLFGAGVSLSIPWWVQVDGDGNVAATSGDNLRTIPEPPGGGAGYVQYAIQVQVGDDKWEVLRRYNEFSQFHRNLQKEKLRIVENFPSTSFSQLVMGQSSSGDSRYDQRRKDLETFLRSAVEAVLIAAMELPNTSDSYSDGSRVVSPRQRLLTLLAEFLDDDHHRLRLVSLSAVANTEAASEALPNSGKQEESLNDIALALGL
eukprot:CAMPEP_0185037418 /NCGR_PEP_ID=MMETSP1103-20130426/31783_1 /TAXON_ID=36769 /ORGANISM="Paraphysomonas bandaiensis, Strain Caron Lab Isolate" /LENGTH=910 /DNA_ID=CAMNT_0027575375 /DNA_START=309 /DNA_END=3041 /DNA_ORIENTATION=-